MQKNGIDHNYSPLQDLTLSAHARFLAHKRAKSRAMMTISVLRTVALIALFLGAFLYAGNYDNQLLELGLIN